MYLSVQLRREVLGHIGVHVRNGSKADTSGPASRQASSCEAWFVSICASVFGPEPLQRAYRYPHQNTATHPGAATQASAGPAHANTKRTQAGVI
jgi:hypothetical protein